MSRASKRAATLSTYGIFTGGVYNGPKVKANPVRNYSLYSALQRAAKIRDVPSANRKLERSFVNFRVARDTARAA